MISPYRDRTAAGRVLAGRLAAYAGRRDVTVLALPRGGVPVGYEVARSLGAPLDVFAVRKLGVPGHEELAMGAIATGGIRVLDGELIDRLGISPAQVARITARETAELRRREEAYRGQRPPAPVQGRTVLLVDDGLATGATMHAAVLALEQRLPARVVVAVPVGSREAVARLAEVADEVVCPLTPSPFHGVGAWYTCFPQTTDAEVRHWLSEAARRSAA